MKLKRFMLGLITVLITFMGCKDYLDREIPTNVKDDQVFVNYDRISQAGYGAYAFIINTIGYNRLNGAMLASASDEADHADNISSIQKFNTGTWNATSNPEDVWGLFYQGIRRANLFLEESADYKNLIYRDTINVANKELYKYRVRDLEWLRAENRFLRAYYYAELIKRYGGVPVLLKSVTDIDELNTYKRKTYEECVQFISDECDAILPLLNESWVGFDSDKWRGRITKGAALALKARVLLYAASPLNNPSNDLVKWQKAAKAAHDVIALNKYALHTDYRGLFRLGNGADGNTEIIFAQQGYNRNDYEKYNYPIGYDQGGLGSTSPSQNLVDAYEMKTTGLPIGENGSGYDPANPYANRDPRLGLSILVNNISFKGRPVEAWVGGLDGLGKFKATTTGYYIRKYVDENLNLAQGATSLHTWMIFRYAEVLLNFAEAMNEAYGPDVTAGYSMSAKKAVDMVRARTGIAMPPLPPGLSADEMRQRIRNERRVEFAFEEHRFFDVRRWKIATQTENKPIMAMKISKNTNGSFSYLVVKAEDRVFSDKMYLYPIPEVEVLKSKGNLVQNPGW